jgi:hypothetical protein
MGRGRARGAANGCTRHDRCDQKHGPHLRTVGAASPAIPARSVSPGLHLPASSVVVATMKDLDKLALAMPATTKVISEDGRPSYLVHGNAFCFHRSQRRDAVDPETGERLDDVLVFRVDGPDEKELVLADPRGVFFTTPHFNGYPAVLIRIPDLAQLERGELRDAVVDAWLTRAQKRVAKAWLREQDSAN